MQKIFLKLIQPVNEDADLATMNQFLPELSIICNNKTRAGILHLLINSPKTLHSMKVEELAFRLGTRPRVIIFHLERMKNWKLLEVKKNQKYGNKERRSIWGIDLRYPNWILECYKTIRTHFFTEDELNEITNQNKSFRNFKKL
jgi:hypothetical protein